MPEVITLQASPNTPAVSFDMNKGLLVIEGRSVPEDPNKFYSLLLELLDDYATKPVAETIINIKLEYFNTGSSKYILSLLKKAESIRKTGFNITINWFYEKGDEDILEAGEDYQDIVNLPFNMIEFE